MLLFHGFSKSANKDESKRRAGVVVHVKLQIKAGGNNQQFLQSKVTVTTFHL